MSIYNTKPNFVMGEQEQEILTRIKNKLYQELKLEDIELKRLSIGQNINYKLYLKNQSNPKYLLRIISKSGYPDLKTLEICNQLVSKIDILYPEIIYFNDQKEIVPYSFFLQEWIEGIDGESKYTNYENDFTWIKDYTTLLKRVHQVKMPYFGYLNGPQYINIYDYYKNLDEVINHSFGTVFHGKESIWDLDKKEITSNCFLSTTFTKINDLAKKLPSNIKPVLVHGDMLPANLVYTNNEIALIDWDETRAHTFVYEIARTSFYFDTKDIVLEFINHYPMNDLSLEEIDIIIRLEHIRQYLRIMMITCFNRNVEEVVENVRELEQLIQQRLYNSYLFIG